jgi:hypothetical protein
MELQNIDKHTGINSWICKDACHLLKSADIVQWSTQHLCNNITECGFCESAVIWHQLCLQLVTFIAPKKFDNLSHVRQFKQNNYFSEYNIIKF